MIPANIRASFCSTLVQQNSENLEMQILTFIILLIYFPIVQSIRQHDVLCVRAYSFIGQFTPLPLAQSANAPMQRVLQNDVQLY